MGYLTDSRLKTPSNQVMQTDVGYASTADHPNRYVGRE
jgi:hypothetical protein